MMNFESFKNKRVLITGASGFFPSHLTHRLQALGAQITVMTKYNSIIDNVRLARIWDQVNVMEADLRNTDSLAQLKQIKPEIIFHMAAYNHVGDSFTHVLESMNTNAIGSVNLMEAFQEYERFVYIATSEVYGYQTSVPFTESMIPFPTSPYSIGKYTGELYARMLHHVKHLPIVVVRPFNAFGPYQSPRAIIAELILKCLRGEPVRTTEGKQTRDFNYVSDLVNGVLHAALERSCIGEVINIGSGHETPICDLVQKIHQMTESRSKLEIGALPNRPTEIWRMVADHDKATRLLGWKSEVSLDEGLRKTIAWYRNFLKVYTDPASPFLAL